MSASLPVKKALDRLAVRANQYSRSLGTAGCEQAFERLKRAARDYANALKVKR